ncbi:putative methyltransferase [Teratosphaeria destructans]|uniref:Ribosomal RNA-processing protein 8 n=1 Tax=Teratosphaeria destructans TaxID=418781 RepID=A0A9W7VYK5_9PEZI|nr:putative methyltransferase [Teratosphaeria destructans]
MFAVKGWSVDAASLKPQTEPFKTSKSVSRDGEQQQGKKRKRGEGKQDANGDVGKLWDKHIEGKQPSKEGVSKNERKRQKHDKKMEKRALKNANNEPLGERKTTEEAQPAVQQIEVSAQVQSAKQGKGRKRNPDESQAAVGAAQEGAKTAPPPLPPVPATAKLTPMQSAMRQKLVSARFRHLNETLYTAPSGQALDLFDQNPDMFEDYHAGFRQQVTTWPENPVDNFIATIRRRGRVKPPKFFKDKKVKAPPPSSEGKPGDAAALPRTHGTAIIADLGCGDARISQTLQDSNDISSLNLKIHSFDLHSPSPLVTKADISDIPLPDGSVDVAIFCLALMGTNWVSFIEEAYRILHWKGELWVAEIKSRFGRVGRKGTPVAHSVGGRKKLAALTKAQDAKAKEVAAVDEQTALRAEVDGVEVPQAETDVSAFVAVLRRRGFLLREGEQQSVDLGNKMFVSMEFVKAAAPTKGKGKPGVEARVKQQQMKKFVEHGVVDDEEVATEDEAGVLKPCLFASISDGAQVGFGWVGGGGQPDSAYAPPITTTTTTCTCGPTHHRPTSPTTTACRFVPATAPNPTSYALCTEAQAFARRCDAGFTAIHLPYNQGVAYPPDKNHPFTRSPSGRRPALAAVPVSPDEAGARGGRGGREVVAGAERRAKRLSGAREAECEALGSGRDRWVVATTGGLGAGVLEEERRQSAVVAPRRRGRSRRGLGGRR